MVRPSYSEERVDEIESRILASALKILEDKEYTGLSLRAVARDLGLTAPALYRYFGSKDELVAELVKRSWDQVYVLIQESLAEDLEPKLKVQGYMRKYLNFVFERPGLFKIMYTIDPNSLSQVVQKKGFAARERARDVFVILGKEYVEAGYSELDPLELTHLWWVGMNGLVTLELAHQLNLGLNKDQLLEPVIHWMTDPNYVKGRGVSQVFKLPARKKRATRRKKAS